MLPNSITVVPDNNFTTNNTPDHRQYKDKAMIDQKVFKSFILKLLDWLIFIGLLGVSVYVMNESIAKFIEKASTFEISSEGIHGHGEGQTFPNSKKIYGNLVSFPKKIQPIITMYIFTIR